VPGVIIFNDILERKLNILSEIPLSHQNRREAFKVLGNDLVAGSDNCKTIEIEIESMSEVQIELACPFEQVDELWAVHIFVEDQVRAELRHIKLEVLTTVAATRVYTYLLHHFTVEFTVFDEQRHQHMEWFDFFVLAQCLFVALGKFNKHGLAVLGG